LACCLAVRRIVDANVGIQNHDRPAVQLGPVARPESDVAVIPPEFLGNFRRQGGPAWFKGAFPALVVDREAGGLRQQRAFEYCRRAHRQATGVRAALLKSAPERNISNASMSPPRRVAREAPERAALGVNAQARVPVFVEHAVSSRLR
jgi:hypothetical protein